jgi:hypothetical protein
VAVYDITEAQHREISYLKANFADTIAYLRSEKIIHAMNHLFRCFPPSGKGRAFLEKMIASFDLFEGLNGAIDEGHNRIMQQLSEMFPGKGLIAGSDSHTLLRLGSCFTACRASNRKEFLEQLHQGKTLISGSYGYFHYMFNDAMGVYLNYFHDLVFRRHVHTHWPFWKELRNALGWIICLPVFFTGALAGLSVRYWIERLRQKDYERLTAEIRNQQNGVSGSMVLLSQS